MINIKTRVRVELDNPVGKNNGVADGQRFFFFPGTQRLGTLGSRKILAPPRFFPPQDLGSRLRFMLHIRIKTVVFPHSFPHHTGTIVVGHRKVNWGSTGYLGYFRRFFPHFYPTIIMRGAAVIDA